MCFEIIGLFAKKIEKGSFNSDDTILNILGEYQQYHSERHTGHESAGGAWEHEVFLYAYIAPEKNGRKKRRLNHQVDDSRKAGYIGTIGKRRTGVCGTVIRGRS